MRWKTISGLCSEELLDLNYVLTNTLAAFTKGKGGSRDISEEAMAEIKTTDDDGLKTS